ncbi:MAG: hypothetical protein ACKOFI_09425 [Phycisphaerales bacterium]
MPLTGAMPCIAAHPAMSIAAPPITGTSTTLDDVFVELVGAPAPSSEESGNG